MRYNNPIRSDDPDAIEKLRDKLEQCEKLQKEMKSQNAYYRKAGTMKGYPNMSDEEAEKIEKRIENAYSWAKCPFSSYTLSNNNAEIRRLKNRIDELTKNKEIGFVGWEFDGGKAVANTEANRLQIFFDEKPYADQCLMLKTNGFKWAPSVKAWQRQLNENAIYAASRMDFLKTKDGKKPYEIQPKEPKKDEKVR